MLAQYLRARKFHVRLAKTSPATAERFRPVVASMKLTTRMLYGAIRISSQKTP
jgi:hypothetical protein